MMSERKVEEKWVDCPYCGSSNPNKPIVDGCLVCRSRRFKIR